jgi:DtxR family Mn-dependent transcriptional regulator
MIKRRDSMGLVNYNSYKGVTLTDPGRRIALEIIRHHRLLELYLKEIMGYSLEKVHDEACRLEHYISDEFSEKIATMLGNPKFDPHGHPIPDKEGNIGSIEEIALSSLDTGATAVVTRLGDDNPDLLAFLEKMRIIPGAHVLMIEKTPFSGPLRIRLHGEDVLIGSETAGSIFVNVE